MRYRIRCPTERSLIFTDGLCGDLHLKPVASRDKLEILVEFTDITDAYAIILPELLGPAGIVFEKLEEAPDKRIAKARSPRRRSKR
jgi:hypothetical protein